MAKIKLTKNEQKNQRDALKRFERFLPTLQLKKQQLQLEVRKAIEECNAMEVKFNEFEESIKTWDSIIEDTSSLNDMLKIQEFITTTKNIAGVEVPVFNKITFAPINYDVFAAPLWHDHYVVAVKEWISLKLQLDILHEQAGCLEEELETVSQRVNLFEKVKIPETKENIRQIQIYLGDQQTNAVGRAKIAKQKCALRDEATTLTVAS